MLRKLFIIFTLFVLALSITGCGEPVKSTNPIDPTFREFYELLGGQEIFGPAISVMYEENGRKLQFTTAALMIFDPQAPESMRFQLAPLGNAMQVADPLSPTSPNGHEIYSGFLPLFQQLGGTRHTGKPLTGIKAEPENKRVVQYFENVGFYQLESDPPDVVHLLDYGVWKCAQACNYRSSKDSVVIPPSAPGYGIAEAVSRLDPVFTGSPLIEPFIASDGRQEQVFENIVIITDSSSPAGIRLRALPALLDISPDTPMTAGQDDGKFIAVDGDKGYNVPYHIDEYIERNSGYDFIGKPITTYNQISEDLYRQCFENLCLDYRPNEAANLQIQPMPLGRRYKQQFLNNASEDASSNSFQEVTLTVWERFPVISFSEMQEIYVMVLDGGTPLKNIDLGLKLTMPDGNQQTAIFPPTDDDGQSWVSLPPIEAPSGTLIVYEVCINNVSNGPECIRDDYLIWGNR